MSGKNRVKNADKKPQRPTKRNLASTDANTTATDESTVEADQAKAGYPFDFAALTADIRDTVAAVVEEKMVIITNKLDTIQTTLDGNTRRLREAEQRISDAEDTIANLEIRMMEAESKLASLAKRMDEQESRSRRDNIRIFGVKEGIEGWDAISFFGAWLPSLLQMETKKGRIRLDRCHRSLGQVRPNVPRAVIMKMHYSTDAMKVLALSKQKKLLFEGATITIHQDLPQSVLQQRRRFNQVCQQLITKGIRFRMQYPATLRFAYNSKSFSFDSAEEAASFVGAMNGQGE